MIQFTRGLYRDPYLEQDNARLGKRCHRRKRNLTVLLRQWNNLGNRKGRQCKKKRKAIRNSKKTNKPNKKLSAIIVYFLALQWKLFILSIEGKQWLMIFQFNRQQKRKYYTIFRNTGPKICCKHLLLLKIQTMYLIIFGCRPEAGRMDPVGLPIPYVHRGRGSVLWDKVVTWATTECCARSGPKIFTGFMDPEIYLISTLPNFLFVR